MPESNQQANRQNSGRGAGKSQYSPAKEDLRALDDLRMQLSEAEFKIEDLNATLRAKDEEIQQVREYFHTYEEENKNMQAQLLEEKLAKEEATKQLEVIQEFQKQSDRHNKDKKSIQQTALKKLELEVDQKEQTINELKNSMKELEINSMQNENILRDELDLVKDKNNKLLKLEATLEVYKNKLKEIPELKSKLTQALRTNLEYENLKGEQKIEQDQIEKL